MRTKTLAIIVATLAVAVVSSVRADTWNGTLKLGGIVLDEEGDLSTVQETYNIHDGFALSHLRLAGTPGTDNYILFNLRDINLDNRSGDFLYRRSSTVRLTAGFDQHRQVYDPIRGVNAERKDWNMTARVTPAKWLRLMGHFNSLTHEGDRLSFPGGTKSILGSGYDQTLKSGGMSFEARKNRHGLAMDYRASSFSDELNGAADRTGRVISARLFAPSRFSNKLTHLVRGAYGISELTAGDIQYKLSTFQYTGLVRPDDRFQFRYNFDAQRMDDEATKLKTDRFQNNFDGTYYYPRGSFDAGYSYETNDDDRRLTSYNGWRVGATLRNAKKYKARLRYAGRVKKDTEELTLLKDVEASHLRGDLEIKVAKGLSVRGGFNLRDREFPDINVESEGSSVRTGLDYSRPGSWHVSAAHTYTKDEYKDRVGGFLASSNVVTGRLDFEKIHDLRLSGGITYMKAGEDLDIEKSIVFFEGTYTLKDDIHLEVKYNIYNYDDFILVDRYYDANVVWFNVAYDLHIE